MLDDFLIQLFHEGKCLESYKIFGAHIETHENRKGVRFTVYAPNAKSVQVVGEFNDWIGENHILERYSDGGIYTIFVPDIEISGMYKYRIETAAGDMIDKADPYAFFSELRPGTASRVFDIEGYDWNDDAWLNKRTKNFEDKVNIYEMHFGSWKMKKEFTKEEDGEFYTYEEMIDLLIPYIKEQGFSHIELLPLLEHPYDGSWGYQVTGFFSATSRYGTPKQLMKFIDACHQAGIGIIMDYVPAHFVRDSHGLYQFDGGSVYEYPNVNQRYTEWDSVYFDVGKEEVRSFLMSSVAFFAEYYHIDGVRFDAISNLIYWKGNKSLGSNDGAITFMQRLNQMINKEYPTMMLIAEDSTDYPNVTKHPSVGGLGFDYKWDLGWMNDTLAYLKMDPIYRKDHHHLLTFSMAYFYHENFILPFSHDEVVHSKATIIDKMWGLYEDKFAQVKTLYLYMLFHPGKKLNFMGNELAEFKEWDEKKELGWNILTYPTHDSFSQFFKQLLKIYNTYPCMYQMDYHYQGFEWLVVDDNKQSVFAIERKDDKGKSLIVVLNFTNNKHVGYKVPVNTPGEYKEILNSDRDIYAGGHYINEGILKTVSKRHLHKNQYLEVDIAPFGGCIIELVKEVKPRKSVSKDKGDK